MKKILFVGVVAALLSIGLVFVSCANKNCSGDGKCDEKSSLTDLAACILDNPSCSTGAGSNKCDC